jgi:imidazole glycerol phosphate synthase subunit HisF
LASFSYNPNASSTNRFISVPLQLKSNAHFNPAPFDNDEITFLNITSYKSMPLHDQPLLELLRETSRRVFVPLTVGGGIRALEMPDGKRISALDVAHEYFQSGADKVSIGIRIVVYFRE